MEIRTVPGYSYVKLCVIPKKEIERLDFDLCRQPAETLEAYYARQSVKPDLLCNGGLFGMKDGKTYFTFRSEGQTVSYIDKYTKGFGITGQGELRSGDYGRDGVSYRDFICGYPVLIKNGRPYSSDVGRELDRRTRRTALGMDEKNVYIMTVDLPGMSFDQLKTVLIQAGVQEAINLDGGGSTRLLAGGKLQTASTVASRAVDNVFAVYLKRETVSAELPILKKGQKGESVKALQELLNLRGYACGAVDGDFGAKTDRALREFQRAAGLTADGECGGKSWGALINN